jgi:hypothetical protein
MMAVMNVVSTLSKDLLIFNGDDESNYINIHTPTISSDILMDGLHIKPRSVNNNGQSLYLLFPNLLLMLC